MFNKVTKTFQYGQHQVTLETGEIARQASGAVMVSIEDTVVLATVVARKDAKPGQDFFPLTVDYVEKTYAAGKIPGGFFKREGRPSEKETLTSRLIDRPIRPLFPEGYLNEVQIIIHVLSVNPEIDPDIAAMIGASAALCVSGVPFNGPIGAARVGYANGQYILNPTTTQLKTSADGPGCRRYRNGRADGRIRSQAAVRRNHARRRRLRPRPDESGHRRDPRPGARRRQAGSRVDPACQERSADRPRQALRRRQDQRCLPDQGQAGAYRQAEGRVLGSDRRPDRRVDAPTTWARSTAPKSATSCSTSKPRSCVRRSSTASHASTAATPAPCARSRSAPASCRAPTVRPCSPAAKPRRWSLPPSAPRATARRSMR